MKIKKLRIVILTLLFGTVGVYFIVNSFALSKMVCTPPNGGDCRIVANPPLSAGCGYDIALLGDRSESMAPSRSAMVNDMKNLVSTMQGTNSQFAVGDLGPKGPISAFNGDVATTHSVIDHSGAMYADDYRDYRIISQRDPRPNRQNLIILFTDTVNSLMPETSADIVKQSGTRVLIVRYPTVDTWGDPDDPEYVLLRTYLAGPASYTGSIINANIVFSKGRINIADYATALAAHANKPCTPPPPGPGPGPTPNPGPGPGTNPGPGDGPGDGGGPGDGSGPDGSGQGTDPGDGTGGGGGGSTSNKPDDKPNPLPSPTGQGDTNKQPELEPSPFFDGKLFAIGSDVDTEDIKGVSIAGRTFGLGWVYLTILLALIAGLVALYFLWWRKMSAKDKGRWKAKLRLR